MNYQSPRQSAAADPTRYGTFPMRIGATVEHKLTKGITLPSGRMLTPGQKMHVDVKDITRAPEADGCSHWMCHPHASIRDAACAGKTFASKAALLAAHGDNRELKKLQEIHCYYAVAHVPASPEKAAVLDKQGNPISEHVPAKPATILLLSDEE